jgi:hypothetical protein
VEITLFRKAGGPLTKKIVLALDGSLQSDSGACVMSYGTARRFGFSRIGELAELIDLFGPDQALALGRLRSDLPAQVEVTTKRKLDGGAAPNLIARTRDDISFRAGEPALALIDYDIKGMPSGVADKIEELGGLWPALASVIPDVTEVARVLRQSTSAGLYRSDTGERLPGSGGIHVYVEVVDGTDIERFLHTLHDRCWLAGLGWQMVEAGGQLLERSIVDRVVGSPERLVFEGAPVLDPPLAQDKASRRPTTIEGGILDSMAACPPLKIVEQARLRELRAKGAARLAPAVAAAQKQFVAERVKQLAERTGMTPALAVRVIERQCAGILLPHVVVPFDDEDLAGATVSDVLADPARFEHATLADPLEGIEHGAGKAKIIRRADGTPWTHSFAHGRTVYRLQYDSRAAEAMLQAAEPDQAAAVFVQLVLASDLRPDEVERLRNLASKISGTGTRALDKLVKRARQERAARQAQKVRERRLAERRDPRSQLPLLGPNAEWLPQMHAINDVLSVVAAVEPPMRNTDTDAVEVRSKRLLSLYLLPPRRPIVTNDTEIHLPAPERWSSMS